MMIRNLAVAAAILLAPFAARAAADDGLKSAILACAADQEAATQLACYNRIAGRLKAETAAPPSRQAAAPRDAAGFGGDSMPFHDIGADQPDRMTAGVTSVTYNFFHQFTVALDNGQVWRQTDSNTGVARFPQTGRKVVTITQGMLGSFRLTIQGEWGAFSVKRIK